MQACSWPGGNPDMQRYHDLEWCAPCFDDARIFQWLTLEGAQAGLSWSIVLSKRAEYQKAFRNFDISFCASLTDADLADISENYGVIKNKLKLWSVRNNAQKALAIRQECGSLSDFLWRYVDFEPVVNHWETEKQMPARSALSEKISGDLKKRGFTFVGPVIIYSFMQAIGMVDDHIRTCPRHTEHRNKTP